MFHDCTQCVDAVEELSEDILFLQEVHRDLRQRGAVLSSWLRGPAQFPNLHTNTTFKYTNPSICTNSMHYILHTLTSGGTLV